MNRIIKLLGKKSAVFIMTFLFMGFFWSLALSSVYEIKDNDSYFYIRMAHLYQEKGLFIQEFPWLYHTSWRDNFAGIHFLWSLILIPFVNFWGDLNGAKLLQSIIVGGIFGTLFLIVDTLLKKQNSFPFLFFFLLPLVPEFLGRLGNTRPIGLAIFLFLLGVLALVNKRNWLLFFISFVFVWSYDGYFALLIIAFIYSLSEFFIGRKMSFLPFMVTLSGSLWGLIINPNFPNTVIKSQVIFTNPIINLFFPVSLEWISPFFINKINAYKLLGYLAFILIVGIAGLFERNRASKSIRALFLFLSTLSFLLLSLMSQRFIEYFVPLAFLFIIAHLDIIVPLEVFSKLERINITRLKFISAKFLLVVVLIIGSGLVWMRILFSMRNSETDYLKNEFSLLRFYGASEFLKTNSRSGDLVFLDRWDMFPYFFYQNTNNYYVVGLNGNSMISYDRRLFFLYDNLIRWGIICDKYVSRCWQKFICQKENNDLVDILKYDFKAKFLVFDRYNLKKVQKYFYFDTLLLQSPELRLVYEDPYFKDVRVYRVF